MRSRKDDFKELAQIREYRPEDAPDIERCFVELQEFERGVEPLRARGESLCEKYLKFMFGRAEERGGRVFVAEAEGRVVGFVCLWLRNPEDELVNAPGEYAYVSDLIVTAEYRGRGVGLALLHAAEDFARDGGASRLKLGVLARNTVARRLYENYGFEESTVLMTKELLTKPDEPSA
jgi:ribosomal protein S18 acetylase RimI-like enzyme